MIRRREGTETRYGWPTGHGCRLESLRVGPGVRHHVTCSMAIPHTLACMHGTHATTKERGLDIDGRDVEEVEEEEGIGDGSSRETKACAETRTSTPSHDPMKWHGRCMSRRHEEWHGQMSFVCKRNVVLVWPGTSIPALHGQGWPRFRVSRGTVRKLAASSDVHRTCERPANVHGCANCRFLIGRSKERSARGPHVRPPNP